MMAFRSYENIFYVGRLNCTISIYYFQYFKLFYIIANYSIVKFSFSSNWLWPRKCGSSLLKRGYHHRWIPVNFVKKWREIVFRSSHREVNCKKGILKNFAKFTGKHLCWSLFNKVIGLRPEACNVIKKETPTLVFPCGFYKIFKNTFFIEHLRCLLQSFIEHLWNLFKKFSYQKWPTGNNFIDILI